MTNLRIEYKEKNSAWYAMKVTYQRIRKAEKILSEKNIENYSPLKTVVKFKNGKKSLEKQPIISNLIFIKANLNELNKIKREINAEFNLQMQLNSY
ncbi:MAG: transcription termination/antitermination NusG family protein [Rikenellaceae bacterium]